MAEIKYILAGASTNFTSVWADPTASINNAKMYVGSSGNGAAFSVVNLCTKELFAAHTLTVSGIDNKTLSQENIDDINVGA